MHNLTKKSPSTGSLKDAANSPTSESTPDVPPTPTTPAPAPAPAHEPAKATAVLQRQMSSETLERYAPCMGTLLQHARVS